jgi:hypothetical protein
MAFRPRTSLFFAGADGGGYRAGAVFHVVA